MRFFRTIEQHRVDHIKTEQKHEYKFASIFRIVSTAVSFLAWGANWFITGDYANPFLYLVLMIVFYWFWFQIIPRVEHEWEREREQKELDFVRLLYKYIDANGLESLLDDLSKRVAELEVSGK